MIQLSLKLKTMIKLFVHPEGQEDWITSMIRPIPMKSMLIDIKNDLENWFFGADFGIVETETVLLDTDTSPCYDYPNGLKIDEISWMIICKLKIRF